MMVKVVLLARVVEMMMISDGHGRLIRGNPRIFLDPSPSVDFFGTMGSPGIRGRL